MRIAVHRFKAGVAGTLHLMRAAIRTSDVQADGAQGGDAADPGAARPLRHRLPGPRERHVRPGQAGERPGLLRSGLRVGAGVFFIGYFLLEVPRTSRSQFGARRWMARIMITLGDHLGLHDARAAAPRASTRVRFLLGMAEAGLLPGHDPVPLRLVPRPRTRPRRRRVHVGDRISYAIGAPISGAIMSVFAAWPA